MMAMNFKKNMWAYGIIATFVLFMALMIGFVIVASNNKISLVVTDYYKAEIEYQGKIDKEANFKSLAQKPQFNYLPGQQVVALSFPMYLVNEGVKGSIQFYKPDAPKKDFIIVLAPDAATGKQLIDVKGKSAGFWRMKMEWQTNGIDYYYEEALTLQ